VINVLVKTEYDYSDEFTVSGFCIMTQEEYEATYIKLVKHFDNDNSTHIECYFGTNESIYLESFKDVWKGMSVSLMTDEETKIIEHIFDRSWGLCTFDQIVDGL
jgi:hypothetical protein